MGFGCGGGCYGAGRERERGDGGAGADDSAIEWEMRPGGMLVQKRCEESGAAGSAFSASAAAPQVTVRVSYGAARFNIAVSSQATFGELKKLLSVETGLLPGDQRLIYKRKERENGDYLDFCGVKNKSKLILEEDPCSQERRHIQLQRNAKIQNIQRAISDVSLEVDKLADQVTAIEKSISSGIKVAEVQISTLTEMLMRQAIKLDAIPAEGDTYSQKNIQAKRVQKCVETLDMQMVSNSRLNSVVVTTKWETFDTPSMTDWEFFD